MYTGLKCQSDIRHFPVIYTDLWLVAHMTGKHVHIATIIYTMYRMEGNFGGGKHW